MVACGGGGGTPTSNAGGNSVTPTTTNVAALVVDSGPAGNYTNGLFTTVTVCVPGTTTCQTIDHVLVDSQSVGLRLVSSVVTLPLTTQTNASGQGIAQCVAYGDGSFTWGPVSTADIQIASEKASAVPIQLIGESQFSVPSGCTGVDDDTVPTLGTNGILGIMPFMQDCGSTCVTGITSPALYYACSSASSCLPTTQPLSAQVSNPIPFFTTDNNGAIIELPGVSQNGAATVSGSLVFGIGTQSNNGLKGAVALATDANGNVGTVFNGTQYTGFFDSGSNALFVLDSGTLGMTTCAAPDDSFYCPGAPNNNALNQRNLSATNFDSLGDQSNVNFSIANAEFLFSQNGGANFAFNNLGGPNAGFFDWGLPFFFGRNVFIAIENQNTPIGAGPYFAY